MYCFIHCSFGYGNDVLNFFSKLLFSRENFIVSSLFADPASEKIGEKVFNEPTLISPAAGFTWQCIRPHAWATARCVGRSALMIEIASIK